MNEIKRVPLLTAARQTVAIYEAQERARQVKDAEAVLGQALYSWTCGTTVERLSIARTEDLGWAIKFTLSDPDIVVTRGDAGWFFTVNGKTGTQVLNGYNLSDWGFVCKALVEAAGKES
jgi:hypothetical protein